MKELKDKSLKEQIESINESNGESIKLIPNPSKDLQLIAVRVSGDAIQYIPDPDEEIQEIAAKEDISNIGFVKNPSEKLLTKYMKINPYAIKNYPNASEKVQLSAVKADGKVICLINNPSLKVKKQSIISDYRAIKHIEDFNSNDELQLTYIKSLGESANIHAIHNPSENVLKELVKCNPDGLFDVLKMGMKVSEEVQYLAVKSNKENFSLLLESGINPSDRTTIEAAAQGVSVDANDYSRLSSEISQLKLQIQSEKRKYLSEIKTEKWYSFINIGIMDECKKQYYFKINDRSFYKGGKDFYDKLDPDVEYENRKREM